MRPTLVRDNVHAIPSNFIPEVAAALRAYAEMIEDGELTVGKMLMVALDENGFLDFAAFGEPFDSAQGIGYLEMAKAKLIEGSWRR